MIRVRHPEDIMTEATSQKVQYIGVQNVGHVSVVVAAFLSAMHQACSCIAHRCQLGQQNPYSFHIEARIHYLRCVFREKVGCLANCTRGVDIVIPEKGDWLEALITSVDFTGSFNDHYSKVLCFSAGDPRGNVDVISPG